ncbi:hypothetical protein FISHEDRAFT_73412 [Fistulina hepatica ATCC 64428]|uniref:F-box domain-containing protein n=1 Tax=Fistulina hepatica ATCC 64428 TaxID=1128425 RepID=A0A0D7AE26_9AGAR|nr:hypothetical protein FISHEDRAFT_73412 [Fistulina hepatica ATCC 64428]
MFVLPAACPLTQSVVDVEAFDKLQRSLSDIPLDVARLVLEFAAHSDRATAASLTLVSHAVSYWIHPILYHCVVLRTVRDNRLLERTLREALSLSPSSVKASVQALAASGGCVLPDTRLLRECCPQLRRLHIYNDMGFLLRCSALFPDTLEELVICGPDLTSCDVPKLMSAPPSADFPVTPSAFPSLKRFAWCYRLAGEAVVEDLVQTLRIMLRVRSLRVALVMLVTPHSVDNVIKVARAVTDADDRAVIITRETSDVDLHAVFDTNAWEGDGTDSLWRLAGKSLP